MVNDYLVIYSKSFRNCFEWTLLNLIPLDRLFLLDWVWFTEYKERKRKIDKTVLKLFQVSKSLGKLVELCKNGACYHSCRSRYSGDDLTSNHFGLPEVAFGYLVVSGTNS